MRLFLRLFIAVCVLVPCTCVRAQVLYVDDFEDGNFLNPEWQGDTSDFRVAEGHLVHTSTSGNIRLPVPDAREADTLIFETLIDFSYAPANNDVCQLQLSDFVGRFMALNFNLARERPLALWFVTGDLNGVVEGESNPVFGSDSKVRVRLSRFREPLVTEQEYRYRLEADYTGGRDFDLQGELLLTDEYRVEQVSIAVNTAEARDNFAFDDLRLYASDAVDSIGPMISQVVLGSDLRRFTLYFDELLANRGRFPFHQIFFAGQSTEITVYEPHIYRNTLFCSTQEPLALRDTLEVVLINTVDEEGDTTAFQSVKFFFDPAIQPAVGQLVINEFMVDPSPPVGLPEVEYVELYNPTEFRLNLNLVQIQTGANPIPLPPDTLDPGGYVVLARPEDVPALAAAGIDATGVPLGRLANNGDGVLLWNSQEVIFSVFYDRSFYNDPEREGNGHSLEYVGGGADAGCSDSWRASLDPTGGTPGRRNSVAGTADVTPPTATRLEVQPDTISLFFSEDLDPDQFTPELFSLNNGATVTEVIVTGETSLQLIADLVPGILYTLTVIADYQDCSGNFPESNQRLRLGIAQPVQPGDVKINELLVSPVAGGGKYLELTNCSEKLLQIDGWRLVNQDNGEATSVTTNRLFPPGEYLTFSEDPTQLLSYYPEVADSSLVLQQLPDLPLNAGDIAVLHGGEVVAEYSYSNDQHYPLLPDFTGVALELRDECAAGPENWFSAAPEVRHGTPTRANSRWMPTLFPPSAFYLRLTRTTFSPDGDGFEDELGLSYGADQPGYQLRLRAFDAQGRPVRFFPPQVLPIGEGTIAWDGRDDEGRRLSRGAYVLLGEVTAPDGRTTEYRFTVVLAG